MTTEEFSNQFDTLLNSYARSIPNGMEYFSYDVVLDEYEKSVYLTEAQRVVVTNYYSGKNAYRLTFEEKEEMREALHALVKTATPDPLAKDAVPSHLENLFDGKRTFTFYPIPDNLLYIVFEEVKFSSYLSGCLKGASALVVPATHDDVWHRLQNPFRGPTNKRVLRINASDNIVELISDYPIGSYLLRYVEEPKPIILTDLPNGLSIEGVSERTECELPDIMHHIILDTAVQAALATKAATLGAKTQSKS